MELAGTVNGIPHLEKPRRSSPKVVFMLFDAIVLAGGRSSRLGGAPKSLLEFRGLSLLEHTLAAASGARQVVVVGPAGAQFPGILHTSESPAFAGPAAAIAAGLTTLCSQERTPAPTILVLACDMPEVAGAVSVLLGAFPLADAEPADSALVGSADDGLLARDAAGRLQYLVALFTTTALQTAIALNTERLVNLSVRSLVSSLDLGSVLVPDRSTRDIDTWSDAAAFGIVTQDGSVTPRAKVIAAAGNSISTTGREANVIPEDGPAKHEEVPAAMEVLAAWVTRLATELGLGDVPVDIDAILSLAGVAAHAVLRPAAPLTTYIVGYAAGRAAATGVISPADAFGRAAEAASALAASQTESAPTGTPE